MMVRRLLGLAVAVTATVTISAQDPPPIPSPPQATSEKGATVTGVVIDAETRVPIGGIEVRLFAVQTEQGPGLLGNEGYSFGIPRPFDYSESLTTAADGRFRFTKVPPGNFELYAYGPVWVQSGWDAAEPDLRGDWMTIRASTVASVIVPMRRSPAVGGRVIDEAGEPVIGVRVSTFTVDPLRHGVQWRQHSLRRTDDRGAFRHVLPAGDPFIIGVLPGVPGEAAESLPSRTVDGRQFAYWSHFLPSAHWTSGAQVLQMGAGEERTTLEFKLARVPVFRISGRISGADRPAAVSISLRAADDRIHDGYANRQFASLGPDGGFQFRAVPSGRYRIRAVDMPQLPFGSHGDPPLEKLPAERTLAADVEINVGDHDVDMPITLLPGVRISGRVEFDGDVADSTLGNLKNIPIFVQPADGRQHDSRGLYLPDRTFVTMAVPAGRYVLKTYAPQGWVVKSIEHRGRSIADEPFDLSDRDMTDVVIAFTMRPASLVGTVTNAPAMRRRPWVIAFPSEPRLWADYGDVPRRFGLVRVGTSGAYEFRLPSGGYYVAAVPSHPRPLTPAMLQTLVASATQVWINDGERREQPLQLPGTAVRR